MPTPTPIKLTLVRAGLEAIERHVEKIPYHANLIRSDLEASYLERERALFISQQCVSIRDALASALRAINAIDKDAQQYLAETDPNPSSHARLPNKD